MYVCIYSEIGDVGGASQINHGLHDGDAGKMGNQIIDLSMG